MEGWIKIFRQFVDWEWYSDTVTFRVFFHLLLKANHKKIKWKGVEIQAGQVFTSYQHIINEIGDKTVTLQRVRTAFSRLKSTYEITYQSTHNGLLVTIENWEKYQLGFEKSTDLSTRLSTFN